MISHGIRGKDSTGFVKEFILGFKERKGCRSGGKGSSLMDTEFHICKMKKFWLSVTQHCEYT